MYELNIYHLLLLFLDGIPTKPHKKEMKTQNEEEKPKRRRKTKMKKKKKKEISFKSIKFITYNPTPIRHQ
jgi:hypothetical protein